MSKDEGDFVEIEQGGLSADPPRLIPEDPKKKQKEKPEDEEEVAIDSDSESAAAAPFHPPRSSSSELLQGKKTEGSHPPDLAAKKPPPNLPSSLEAEDPEGPSASMHSRRRHSLGPKFNFKFENRGKKRAFEEEEEVVAEVSAPDEDEEAMLEVGDEKALKVPQEPKEKKARTKGKANPTARRHSFHVGAETAAWREFNQKFNGLPKKGGKMTSAATQTEADILRRALNIPKDTESIEKMKNVIHFQFDLELLMKHQEVAVIQERVKQAEDLMKEMESLKQVAQKEAPKAPKGRTTFNSSFTGVGPSSAVVAPALLNPLPSRPTPTFPLYSMLEDGRFLKWICPQCKKTTFSNMVGVRNHCRMSHKLTFAATDEFINKCTVSVPESEVPKSHPCRLKPLSFEGDAVIVSESLESVKQELSSTLQALEKPGVAAKGDNGAQDSSESSESSEGEAEQNGPSDSHKTVPLSTRRPSISAPPLMAFREDEEDEEELDSSEKQNRTLLNSLRDAAQSQSHVISAVINQSQGGRKSGDPQEIKRLEAQQVEDGSRFHIARNIVIGNSSVFLSPDQRSSPEMTHRWMIFVTGETEDTDLHFIQKVRFFLHPSYQPDNIVDILEPPFTLKRPGWGEFPIRVQLHFQNPRRNKPIDIVHQLKLENSSRELVARGNEHVYQIELDRRTFEETQEETSLKQRSLQSEADIAIDIEDNDADWEYTNPIDYLNHFLTDSVQHFPIIRPASKSGKEETLLFNYTCAESLQDFLSWSYGRRKSLERRRANLLKQYTQVNSPGVLLKQFSDALAREEKLASQVYVEGRIERTKFELTTKDVMIWCRTNGHTPQRVLLRRKSIGPALESSQKAEPKEVSVILASPFSRPSKALYCKYCGSSHSPKICPRRLKRRKIMSISPPNVAFLKSLPKKPLLPVAKRVVNTFAGRSEADNMLGNDIDILGDESITTLAEMVVEEEPLGDPVELSPSESWVSRTIESVGVHLPVQENKAPPQTQDLTRMLWEATKIFARTLTKEAIDTCLQERAEDGPEGEGERMMTPLHIFKVLCTKPTYDLFTNQGLLSSKRSGNPFGSSS